MKKIGVLFGGSIAVSAVVVTGVSLHSNVFVRYLTETQKLERETDRREATAVLTEEKRKVYPYSIVPGGARTVEEARRAMRDPAVRDHYAAVDLSKLRQVTLTADLSGYLSYRYGDKIYWTAKTLVLKAGETVYTDGDHVVRGRCLNRYSAHPMSPIQPHGPSEKTLNTPVEVPLIALTFPLVPLPYTPTLPIPPGELTPTVPTLTSTASSPGGRKFFPIIPIIPIIPPIHHRPNSPGATSIPVGGPPPVVVPPITAVAPEPEYRWLLVGALCLLVLVKKIAGSRKSSSVL